MNAWVSDGDRNFAKGRLVSPLSHWNSSISGESDNCVLSVSMGYSYSMFPLYFFVEGKNTVQNVCKFIEVQRDVDLLNKYKQKVDEQHRMGEAAYPVAGQRYTR